MNSVVITMNIKTTDVHIKNFHYICNDDQVNDIKPLMNDIVYHLRNCCCDITNKRLPLRLQLKQITITEVKTLEAHNKLTGAEFKELTVE